ncbi:MAG TPA: cation-transporting P-type ATPase [Nitrosomonas sp.]|nr:cation-transporting P-type ATPase [Nitrosomonas sp.]
MIDSKHHSNILWHSQALEEIITSLETSANGLSQVEAALRLQRDGYNRLTPPRQISSLMRFLLQFHNVLIYVLLLGALITGFLGHWVDTGVIVGVVFINAIIGSVQQGKAEKALSAIRHMLSLDAMVLRDGKRKQIPAEELVVGDIVLLQSGDKVPADLRLLQVKNLRIEEAALTGESEAVEKSIATVAEQAVIGDRFNMAYSSTLVVYGQGTGVVVATSDQTEIGRISRLLEQVDMLETPLLRQMASFGRWLSMVIGVLTVCIFAYGLWIGRYSTHEMFLAAVGIAVAAIPEGLPAIMTITLALGVQRMAKQHAIIRRLPAVEALGSVTVICTDKTGTLTRNEMTVQRIITTHHQLEVSGVGYQPQGGFSENNQAVCLDTYQGEHRELYDLIRTGLLCNDAQLRQQGDDWCVEGDPTEGALITLALKADLKPILEHESLPRIDIIPFESQHRFMATLHHKYPDTGMVLIKGAPEKILSMCVNEGSWNHHCPLNIGYWHQKVQASAMQGQRVLALAAKSVDIQQTTLNAEQMLGGFTILGLVGIIDPPREEAIRAVSLCQSAGIRVKMITGDHATTAQAIGVQLGIGDGQTSLSGQEIEYMDAIALQSTVLENDVFARASPEHKLRLVEALQARGEIVAMTGDGVNDAPALKRADIGVAMGKKGTEVAKEAAKIIITDDNFASISQAVQEGRTAYNNIQKTILYILPTNGGEVGIVIIAILLGITLPITPLQILWINMVTETTLSLSLAFEKTEPNIMQRSPRKPSDPIMSGLMFWRVILVSFLLTISGLALFFWELTQNASIEEVRTIVVNALVMGEICYLLNCRYLYSSSLSYQGIFGNRYALSAIGLLAILQLMFTYHPLMQQWFGTAAIDLVAWFKILTLGVGLFLIIEFEKWLMRRYRAN